MNVAVDVMAPDPNTWHEVLAAIEGRSERRIAVQLYGRPHPELLEALAQRGADVHAVPVYQWQLPEDTGPLREAIRLLADGAFDVTLWTTSQQVVHLLEAAADMHLETEVRRAIEKSFVASIGPTTSEMLREYGFEPDLEPSHPKLGFLVKEAAERGKT